MGEVQEAAVKRGLSEEMEAPDPLFAPLVRLMRRGAELWCRPKEFSVCK